MLFVFCFQLIGSSLLFVHDAQKANVWLIDFGKTVPTPENLNIDHKSPWEVGNHEDGYLIGIKNLIDIYTELISKLIADAEASSPTSSSSHKTESDSPQKEGGKQAAAAAVPAAVDATAAAATKDRADS